MPAGEAKGPFGMIRFCDLGGQMYYVCCVSRVSDCFDQHVTTMCEWCVQYESHRIRNLLNILYKGSEPKTQKSRVFFPFDSVAV